MEEQGDSTFVTGSPSGSHAPPGAGQVLAERYEIKERLGADPFTIDYLALDHETESTVLVRVVDPGRLSADDARNAARRLSRVLGAGGKYLSPLLDADCEGAILFVVEPVVPGTTLREVIRARGARGEILAPHEVLPVAARLAAALQAVPPPFRHGDVRAERVVIEPDALALTCPFLLGALPVEMVETVLREDARLARMFAPEVPAGTAGDSADRYGVACIVFEALTGRVPEPGAASASELGALGEVLRAMLGPDPSQRPGSLDPLLAVLATRADLPVPALDPAPFRQPRRLSIRRKSEPAMPVVTDDEELVSKDTDRAPAKATPERREPAATIEMTSAPMMETPPEPERRPTPPPTAVAPPAPVPPSAAAPAAAPGPAIPPPPAMAASPAAAPLPASRRQRAHRDTIEMAQLPDFSVDAASDPDENTRPVVRVDDKGNPVREGPKRRPIEGAAADGTQELEIDQVLVEPRVVPGAAPDGTQEIDASELQEDVPRTAQAGNDSDVGLDPRLVRAALGVELSGADESDETTPTRRAADPASRVPEAAGPRAAAPAPLVPIKPVSGPPPGRTGGSPPATQRPLSAPPAAGTSSYRPPSPAGAGAPTGAAEMHPRNPTLELGPGDIEMVEAEAAKLPSIREPVTRQASAKPKRRRPEVHPEPVELPRDIKPIPTPRLDSVPPPARRGRTPALFDDSHAGRAPAAVSAPASYVPRAAEPLPARSRRAGMDMETWHDLGEPEPMAPARQPFSSKWIVLIAAFLGLLIIAGGWFIAEQRRSNIEREQRLQQRFEQLRGTEPPRDDPPAGE